MLQTQWCFIADFSTFDVEILHKISENVENMENFQGVDSVEYDADTINFTIRASYTILSMHETIKIPLTSLKCSLISTLNSSEIFF